MAVTLGAGGQARQLTDPRIGAGGQVRLVQEIRVGTPTGPKVVWFRQPLALAAAPARWDQVALTITPPGAGADSYTISRGGTALHTGPETAWTDTGLLPATGYSYTVQAYRGGELVGTATAAATTPARADLGLTATAAAYNRNTLAWTDPSAGSIDSYRLKRGSTVIYTGTAKTYSDTGLAASTKYSYTLEALRGGTVIAPTDTASATTPARPTTQKTVTLSAADTACYSGSGAMRTDTSDCYFGYYSGTWGLQKSQARFAVPADLRNCISVDKVEVSIYGVHTYPNGGTTTDLVVHHNSSLGSSFGGSTSGVKQAAIGKPGWFGGAEWLNVTTNTSSRGYTVAEEFRSKGAQGVGLQAPGGSTSQTYYGYARNDWRIRFTYTVYAS